MTPVSDGEVGYTRDRSFYTSRPGGGGVKVHRESKVVAEMASCNTRFIMLYMEQVWDVAKVRRDCPNLLCRRCWRT